MRVESAKKQSLELDPIISDLECFLVRCIRPFVSFLPGLSTWSEVEVTVDVRATNLSQPWYN